MTATKKATKKKTRKKTSTAELNPIDLKPADYNPRKMSEEAGTGLKNSMEEFGDISGITWNRKTGNIVTGHHRWKNICEKYELENLEFKEVSEEKIAIHTVDGEYTGFDIRVVDWNITKEKAANVSANSHKIEGEFTEGLVSLLAEIKTDMDDDLYSGLMLDDLNFEMEYLTTSGGSADDEEWQSDIEAIKKTKEDDHQEKPTTATITLTVGVEDKENILNALKGVLSDFNYEIK